VRKKILILVLLNATLTLNAQDLKLWYNEPAKLWTDALPLGNGRIGAMVFGGVANDRIQFNEETLWTGEPRNYNKKDAYKFLEPIRKLLNEGKQKEAEALAEKEFMGVKSNEGIKTEWLTKVTDDAKFANINYNDENWKQLEVPAYNGWESVGLTDVDGAIWFRRNFTIENYDAQKEYILDLNKISNSDYTYINGKLIGAKEDANARLYPISNSLLHNGENSIAILVINYKDKGGIFGYKDTTKHIGIYPKQNEKELTSLNGLWKYYIANDNPPAVGTYQASYQPFGDVNLQFTNAENFTNYKRSLDIEKAIVSTTYSCNNINYGREYFISQPNQLMAIHLTASQKKSINVNIAFNSPHKNYVVKKVNDNTIALLVQVKNGALFGESHLTVKINGGTVKIENEKLVIANADEAFIYVTAATNFVNYKKVDTVVHQKNLFAYKNISTTNYNKIKIAHIKEYQKYFNTFSIKLWNSQSVATEIPPLGGGGATNERLKNFAANPDPSFVALYTQYGRYLLIASSRPGTKPANLQGIWNESLNPPWGSKYTTNINAEMNYWPAAALNLLPMQQPLFAMIKELSETGKVTAKEYYNAPGFVVHHNTDIWRGTAPINASNHGIWVTGGAWLCQHLWEHYLYTNDKIFLQKNAYPIMKEAALFFNSYLVKDTATEYFISSPSNSPEQGGLVAGPTMDHQIIRTLFNNVITASQILNTDKTFAEGLEEKVKLIAPNQIGKYGQLQEWLQDKDDTTNKHRHISHLWAVYPGNEINWVYTPKLMKAAKQSLIYRGDDATGWSLAWKMNCWARFSDAEHSFKMLKMLLSPVKAGAGSYNNLFDAHPPFQIDGNFGAAAAISEMLVQSHLHFIHILPALPQALENGSVKGLLVHGGFELDMKWKNGKLEKLRVKSNEGKTLTLFYRNQYLQMNPKKNEVINFTFDGKWNF
jgi:alpha-L-fucosidase 2